MYNHARTSNLTTYLTYPATLGSHSGQASPHQHPCQGPFEPLVHQWSSLWNRELPMLPLCSQHSVHCLVSHICPVIRFKPIMLHAHAYASMVHNRFHQFCGTRRTPRTHQDSLHYKAYLCFTCSRIWDIKQNNEWEAERWQKHISSGQSLTD